MIEDSYQFNSNTGLKSRYSIPLTDTEFIIEQHDSIGCFCRILWSTLWNNGVQMHAKYLTKAWGGGREHRGIFSYS